MKKQISPGASAPSAPGSANVSAAGCDESVRMQAGKECPAACAYGIDSIGEPCRECDGGRDEERRRAWLRSRDTYAAAARDLPWVGAGLRAEVSEDDRNRWAREHLTTATRERVEGTGYCLSGDSIVVVMPGYMPGDVRVFDCLIRRHIYVDAPDASEVSR